MKHLCAEMIAAVDPIQSLLWQAAWSWGINGSVSVVSAVLAAIVAVEWGFSAVLFCACVAYLLAAVAGLGATCRGYLSW